MLKIFQQSSLSTAIIMLISTSAPKAFGLLIMPFTQCNGQLVFLQGFIEPAIKYNVTYHLSNKFQLQEQGFYLYAET